MNNRFVALVKPKPQGKIDYFGPFVSETKAFEFLDRQTVEPGGFKLCKPLQLAHVS